MSTKTSLSFNEKDASQAGIDSETSTLQKPLVRSFDIFDTLIARTVRQPTDVFDIVERTGVPDFKKLRIQAQAASNHTWANIYQNYQSLTGVDDAELNRIQRLELQVESEISYLISDTYQQVRDGDILVSDMYLTKEMLVSLLKAVGFDKQVEIFVSHAGKANGTIWPVLKQKFEIEHHLGDNLLSDVQSPARHGIASTHYLGTKDSPMEALLAKRGALTLAAIVKRFRLTNPFMLGTSESKLYDAQAAVNLPFLLLMANHLHDMKVNEGLSRILFTTRDCCLLQPVYELLFPNDDSETFYSSRIALMERRPSYINYVKKIYLPEKTLIFDLHGAFRSGRDLFQNIFGTLPRVHIFGFAAGRAPDFSGLTFDVSSTSARVETLNADCVGTLITVDDTGQPIRAPLSAFFTRIGTLYRTILARFVEAIRPNLEAVRRELVSLSGDVPWREIHDLILEVINRTRELSTADLSEHKSLTQIMNEARSDKGSTFACAHCYTYVYERLLHDMSYRDNFSLLEIGLNPEGHDDIPSIRGWRSYAGSRVKLYGADINPQFLRHHDPANNIHILVADQSDPASLARCGLENPSGYDIIIDDGSHMSSHQQITLRTLWQFLRPGGIYVIENMHYQPKPEGVIGTRKLLQLWRDKTPAVTQYLQRTDALRIQRETIAIEFHNSLSRRWGDKTRDALVVIRKQT